MNDLQRHKKSDTIKWIIVFVAIIVLFAGMIASITNGFTDFNQYGWFDEENKQENADVTNGDGEKLTSGNNYDMPSAMIFKKATALSTSAGDGITVTATVKPDTAQNKLVDWTVDWQNPESTFANGKVATDYVQVTPSGDGSTTATVTCSAPFGEQIKVSVISRANPGIYAIMTVDYQKKIVGVTSITTNENYTFDGTTLSLDDASTWNKSDNLYTDYWELNYEYSIGTVEPSAITNTTFYIKSSDELATAVTSAKTSYVQILDNRSDLLEKALGFSLFSEKPDKTKPPIYQTGDDGEQIAVWPTITTFNSSSWNNAVNAFNNLNGYAFDLKIVNQFSNGDQTEVVVQIYVDKNSIGAQANSVELSKENIIF